ncbi:hypothetical protein ON010_g18022 [Phytophthora cinnamomi]|nr:hypothetical protein ON010_g18022 [Phytophthora cinnamomi]
MCSRLEPPAPALQQCWIGNARRISARCRRTGPSAGAKQFSRLNCHGVDAFRAAVEHRHRRRQRPAAGCALVPRGGHGGPVAVPHAAAPRARGRGRRGGRGLRPGVRLQAHPAVHDGLGQRRAPAAVAALAAGVPRRPVRWALRAAPGAAAAGRGRRPLGRRAAGTGGRAQRRRGRPAGLKSGPRRRGRGCGAAFAVRGQRAVRAGLAAAIYFLLQAALRAGLVRLLHRGPLGAGGHAVPARVQRRPVLGRRLRGRRGARPGLVRPLQQRPGLRRRLLRAGRGVPAGAPGARVRDVRRAGSVHDLGELDLHDDRVRRSRGVALELLDHLLGLPLLLDVQRAQEHPDDRGLRNDDDLVLSQRIDGDLARRARADRLPGPEGGAALRALCDDEFVRVDLYRIAAVSAGSPCVERPALGSTG